MRDENQLFPYEVPAESEGEPEPEVASAPPPLSDAPADVVIGYIRTPDFLALFHAPYLRLTATDIWAVANPQTQNLLVKDLLTRLVESSRGLAAAAALRALGNPAVRSSRTQLDTPAKLFTPKSKPGGGRLNSLSPQQKYDYICNSIHQHFVIVVERRGIIALQKECARELAHITDNHVMLDLQSALAHSRDASHRICFLEFAEVEIEYPTTAAVVERTVLQALFPTDQEL